MTYYKIYLKYAEMSNFTEWRWVTGVSEENIDASVNVAGAKMLTHAEKNRVLNIMDEAIRYGYLEVDFDFDTDIRLVEFPVDETIEELRMI